MPKCFLLLGGQGTRLFPLTNFIHKSMIPVCGKPILEYIVRTLRDNEITDLIFCVSNSSNSYQFAYHFEDGLKFGTKIRYSAGAKSLNTAGRILNAKELIEDTFIVYYGDILCNVDFKQLYKFHTEKGGIGTILFSSILPVSYGTGVLDQNSRVLEVKEKPSLPLSTNIGIYILEPGILNYIKKDSDFFSDVFPRAIKNGEKIFGYVSDCGWLDIGTLDNLQKAESFVNQNFSMNKNPKLYLNMKK